MAIGTSDVRPGKCFANRADDSVRRVVTVKDGSVTFDARGRKVTSKVWPTRAELSVADFLAEAAVEVGCDYRPTGATVAYSS